jgi:hypothetical protein
LLLLGLLYFIAKLLLTGSCPGDFFSLQFSPLCCTGGADC